MVNESIYGSIKPRAADRNKPVFAMRYNRGGQAVYQGAGQPPQSIYLYFGASFIDDYSMHYLKAAAHSRFIIPKAGYYLLTLSIEGDLIAFNYSPSAIQVTFNFILNDAVVAIYPQQQSHFVAHPVSNTQYTLNLTVLCPLFINTGDELDITATVDGLGPAGSQGAEFDIFTESLQISLLR